nr:unnamed protein product [Spirometra erinaceieuropaei]
MVSRRSDGVCLWGALIATAGRGPLVDFVDSFGDPTFNDISGDALGSSTNLSPGEPDPTRRGDSRCWEILLWDPKNFNDGDAKSQEALSRLMTIACSPAVRTCGLNMEYTFHLLCKFKGNMEQSLRALLQESFIVLDNVYAEFPWSSGVVSLAACPPLNMATK